MYFIRKMVKNTTGGNKAKSKASKNFIKPTNTYLRTADSEFELYAQVTRVLGNGMCHVLCANDGQTRLCHIRGKFRGRGKGDNIVKNGSWLLVGLREWENSSGTGKKIQNCDLLEVYNDSEKDKLKLTVKIDWSAFTSNDNKNMNLDEGETGLVFTDEKANEYADIIENELKSAPITIHIDGEEIDVDDI
jgi:initiation factor 1A